MKKILLSLCLLFGVFFSFLDVEAYKGENLENTIKNQLNFYFKKYEKKYGKKQTIDIFKKINTTVLTKKSKEKSIIKTRIFSIIINHILIMLHTPIDGEIISKDLSDGISIKQSKNGIGYIDLYIYGKKIHTSNAITNTYCNPYSAPFDCIYEIEDIYNIPMDIQEKMKQKALQSYSIRTTKNPDFSIVTISGYEWVDSYIIDTKNKKIITSYLGHITNFQSGKNGIYFMAGSRGPATLNFVNNENKIIKLFPLNDSQKSLFDYELMNLGIIKLFLQENYLNSVIKTEEKININDYN